MAYFTFIHKIVLVPFFFKETFVQGTFFIFLDTVSVAGVFEGGIIRPLMKTVMASKEGIQNCKSLVVVVLFDVVTVKDFISLAHLS